MCTRKFVVTRTMLGNREQGWALWNGKEMVEMTSKEIKTALMKKEELHGLAIGADGELELDKGFFTRNIMEHRQVGNYKPMVEDENCLANIFYIVTGATGNGEYEVISSKFERAVISEEKVRVMLTMGIISAGAKLENNKIVIPVLEAAKPVVEKELPAEDGKTAKEIKEKPEGAVKTAGLVNGAVEKVVAESAKVEKKPEEKKSESAKVEKKPEEKKAEPAKVESKPAESKAAETKKPEPAASKAVAVTKK